MNYTLDNTSISSNITSGISSTCLVLYSIGGLAVCVFVIPFNIWALLLIGGKMTMNGRSASPDILTLNLFYTCIIVGLVFILYFINYKLLINVLSSIIILFNLISFVAQAQFHSWICIEHCLAVVFPIFYLKLKQFRYRLVWVSFTWISSVIYGVIVSLNYSSHKWLHSVPYSLMLLVIIICNLATLAALRQPSPSNGERREMHLLKVKAFKIISLIMFVLVVGYYPIICVSLLENSLTSDNVCIAKAISFWLFLPGCVVHSLLYLSKLNRLPCALI